MRLLKTQTDASETHTLEIQEFEDDDIPKYAILSHRWGKDELTLQDVERGVTTKDGFKKVQQCCSVAKRDGFDYLWIDTCCIDKTSSAELSEAINSMYLWYLKADRCYAYLADVPSKSTQVEKSEWFTRGWTLQELLAPAELFFLDENWKSLGTKESLQELISTCTGIPVNILLGIDDLDTCSVAQRMSWAAKRNTKRLEDRAYCLLGIFGINMPLLYGEGERAFIRLQEEIMRVSDDQSLFAWTSPDDRGGLLATSPAAFENSGNIIQLDSFNDLYGITISSKGVHLDLQCVGWGPQRLGLAILHCKKQDGPDHQIAIYVRDLTGTMERFKRVGSNELKRLDITQFRSLKYPVRRVCIQRGRIIPTQRSNHFGESNSIELYKGSDDGMLEKLMSLAQPGALLHAAQEGRLDDVWLTLTHSDIDIDSRGPDTWPALFHAVNNGHEAVVKLLLARGASISTRDGDYYTPLVLAAEKGHEGVAKLLLEKGADLKVKDRQGQTPLSRAVEKGHEDIVNLLFDKGADLNGNGGDQTLLLKAVVNGHEDIVKLLLSKGADLEENGGSRTLLSRAIENGHEGIVKLLFEKGADLDINERHGRMLLFWAVEKGYEDIVKLLLEKGADIESKDRHGRTLLFWAVEKEHEGIVKLLLEMGADIKGNDQQGHMLLFWALGKNYEDIVRLLLEKEADIEERD